MIDMIALIASWGWVYHADRQCWRHAHAPHHRVVCGDGIERESEDWNLEEAYDWTRAILAISTSA